MLEHIELLKLISAIIIYVTAISAGAYPFLKKIKSSHGLEFPLSEALAAGIFLGAGLLHMLSDSSADFVEEGYTYPIAFLIAGGTFLTLLLLEHVSREFYKDHKKSTNAFAIIATLMLSIHSFLAGGALGLTHTLSSLLIILIAIMAHKWAASFALAVQISKSKLELKSGIFLFLIFASMVPLGILFGNAAINNLSSYPLLEPTFSAIAAGTFLYLGTLHGLKQSVLVEKCCNLKQFSFVIVGFIGMAIVAIWT